MKYCNQIVLNLKALRSSVCSLVRLFARPSVRLFAPPSVRSSVCSLVRPLRTILCANQKKKKIHDTFFFTSFYHFSSFFFYFSFSHCLFCAFLDRVMLYVMNIVCRSYALFSKRKLWLRTEILSTEKCSILNSDLFP